MSKGKLSGALVILLLILIWALRAEIFNYFFLQPPTIKSNVAKLTLPEVSAELHSTLTEYYNAHNLTAEEYIISTFAEHDIVFVGEYHRLQHDPELIRNLIPALYQNGIYNLGMEFASYHDQPLIDSLLSAPTYLPSLANKILYDFAIYWGYQDYADIFRAGWELNHSLADSARRFHIVGLNVYEDWSYIKTSADKNNPALLRKVYADGDHDRFMANVVLQEFVNKGDKALIYSGMHHAFTRYRLARATGSGAESPSTYLNRMGNIVFQNIGKKAFTICLHHPWQATPGGATKLVYPADGYIDAFMKSRTDQNQSFGFDTQGTPFGALPCNTSIYKHTGSDLLLQDFCDGYIYRFPFPDYRGLTPVKGFINSDNFAEALRRLDNPNANIGLITLLGPAVLERVLTKDAWMVPYQLRYLQ